MNLKNYTSKSPAVNSINNIEKKLVSVGAKNINKEYDEGVLKRITFLVDVNGNTAVFKLPAKIDTIFDVLWSQVKRPQPGTKDRIKAQAERTAWKILSDWVEVQCTMILLQQAELAEVFLPYYYNPSLQQTLWNQVNEGSIKLLQ